MLLIDGKPVEVKGRKTLAPGEQTWVKLSSGDCCPRVVYPHQYVFHKTLADDPEHLLPGSGKTGGAEATATDWFQDPNHSGANLITDFDGTTACLADLVRVEGYHGNQANPYSIGHELKEVKGGGWYEATRDAAVDVCLTVCSTVGIQWQCPITYRGKPLERYRDGGRNLIGIFGHRDITDRRGHWDPGDLIFDSLEQRGVERFDFDTKQDLDVWSDRQLWLRELGLYQGLIDGIPGKLTTTALAQLGYPKGIFVLWRTMAEQPILPPGYSAH